MPCPKARTIVKTVAPACPGSRLVRLPRWKKVGLLALVNLVLFAVTGVIGEVGFRLFWNPKYYIHCDQWAVGSGMTAAGRKYWRNSTYQIESSEFRVTFRTNAQGYRARPGPSGTGRPYRIAFVGDSFTEGMQVDYDKTFCAHRARTGRLRSGARGGLRELWRGRDGPLRVLAPDHARRLAARSARCAGLVHLPRE